MAELIDQDLNGSRLERVDLSNSDLVRVSLKESRIHRLDLSDARMRWIKMHGTKFIGVEMYDVEITGEFVNLVLNGVDVAPLIEAELDRQTPERAKMRAEDPAGFREAWAILLRLWDETVARARTLPEEKLHESVEGEWSFIQTLRHLGFATAVWVGRLVRGEPSPLHPLDLPWGEAPAWDWFTPDWDARPSLDEVLAVRRERQAMVGAVIDGLTEELLAQTVTPPASPGWPDFPATVKECLRVILNEEWEHRRYAERDLGALSPGFRDDSRPDS